MARLRCDPSAREARRDSSVCELLDLVVLQPAQTPLDRCLYSYLIDTSAMIVITSTWAVSPLSCTGIEWKNARYTPYRDIIAVPFNAPAFLGPWISWLPRNGTSSALETAIINAYRVNLKTCVLPHNPEFLLTVKLPLSL